jgi:hypothetical protein
MAESFDYGKTWNEKHLGKTTGKTGYVDRSNYINFSGINNYTYAYYQIGWPSIIKYGGKYLMYFNAFPRGNYAAKEVTGANTWEQYWMLNIRQTISFNRTANVFTGNLLLAESVDGINFTYVGEVKNLNNSTAYCYNPDLALIGGNKALVTYNGNLSSLDVFGELIQNSSGSWVTSIAFFDLNDPLTIRPVNKLAQNTFSKETIAFYPTLFDNDRETVTPQLLHDGSGNLLGIGYGQWRKPNASDSYIAMANLQNYAVIKQDGKIVSDFNLSSCPDETIITSFAHSDIQKNMWLVYSYNNLNLNRKDKLDNAVIEIYDIYGNLLIKTKPFTIKPGDEFSLIKNN